MSESVGLFSGGLGVFDNSITAFSSGVPQFSSGKLKANLVVGRDCVIVSNVVWHALYRWYGGGPGTLTPLSQVLLTPLSQVLLTPLSQVL